MFNNKIFHMQVSIFNEILIKFLITFSNFTSNKLATFDMDPLGWKIYIYIYIYIENGYKCNDYLQLKKPAVPVYQVIFKRKEYYHNILASKLNNPKTSTIAYW